MTLHEFILLPHRWAWGGVGGCDCTLFCADWVIEATGRDPGARLRGTYHDAEGANAILRGSGGAETLVGRELERLGFARTDAPRDGDIGIVEVETGFDLAEGRTLIPAIKFGPLWAVMSARGAQVKALEWKGAAWRIS